MDYYDNITDYNGTSNSTENHNDSMDEFRIEDWVEVSLYSVAFFVGGPLNIISFVRLVKALRRLKHPSPILLLRLNLNIADLFTLFLYVPKQIIWLIAQQWYGGDVLCRLCAFFSTFCFYLHSFVIACIAIDRLMGAWNINSVSGCRRAYTRVSRLLFASWLLATILALPQTLIFKVYENIGMLDQNITQCASFWMKARYDANNIFLDPDISDMFKTQVAMEMQLLILYERWYSVAHLVFNFVLPTMTIFFSYTTLLFVLKGFIKVGAQVVADPGSPRRNSQQTLQGDLHDDVSSLGMSKGDGTEVSMSMDDMRPKRPKKKEQRAFITPFAAGKIAKARKEAKRQAALILLAFLVCWSPYYVMSILKVAGVFHNSLNQYEFLNSLITANPIINPIIYGVFRAV
ncbi:unnamed protein product, partial [Mesorhabditis spiculigera]